jgi:hypothetical protein
MAETHRAPIDPNVKVPAAVLRNSARSDAVHAAAYADPNAPPIDPNASPLPDPNAPPATPTVSSAPPATPSAPPSVGDTNWEHKFVTMKGRYDKAEITIGQQQTTIANLNQRIVSMENTIAALAAAPPPAAAPAPELNAAALAADTEVFGPDFMAAVARQAEAVMKPKMDALEAENNKLRNQVSGVVTTVVQDGRQKMLERLDRDLPTWHEQNRDPNFLAWLRLQDPFSGAIRGELLGRAFEHNETDRVLAFFKGFLTEEATVAPVTPTAAPAPSTEGRTSLESLAAPGRAKSAATPNAGSPEKPIITRAQIAQFYVDVRQGKYNGRDAEKMSDEQMIFAAEREGRIR